MPPWEVLLVCILLSSIVAYELAPAQADEVDDFVNYKEEEVKRIAQWATENDEQRCELVQSCSEPTACTRGGCSPRKNDNLTCTTLVGSNLCLKRGNCNNKIKLNLEESYVRYTKYDYIKSDDPDYFPDYVPVEMRDSICSQRMLDPLFKQLFQVQQNRNDSSEDYPFNFSFYFGAVDGSFRFYPGSEDKECSGYDPRLRPWYLGAISVKKDMVVLLDTGASMDTTSSQDANILTQHLLKTLTYNESDTATVITFDSTQTSRLLAINGSTSDSELENQLLRVNGTRARPASGPSSYTAALLEGVSTLNDSSSGNLKIIVLFTDGKSTVLTNNQLAEIVKDLEDLSIRLFIYEITDADPSLSSIACSLKQGYTYHESINPLRALQNPLYSLVSYFTFLARSHKQTGGQPYWQPLYLDYGNLGSILTVAVPAMSSDGHRLIGVAGIDVQSSHISDILSQIVKRLQSRNNTAVNQQGVVFDNCTAVPEVDGCSTAASDQPICAKDDFKSTYQDLICCADCSIHDDRDLNYQEVAIIAVLSVGAALGLVVGGFVLYFRICKRRIIPRPIVDIVKVPKFSYEELYLATNRFSDSNKLGEGTFGVVYRGDFDNGKKVAVKKLHLKIDHDLKDFEAEIRVLAIANHNHLLALKGFCVDQYSYMLVCEFLENGDLDDWLFEKPLENPSKVLSWAQRVVIAKGTAKGLAYLHEELQNEQKVCHSDIKPANILLDKDFNPKVADFGMAKLYDRGTDVYPDGGTLGYMAPEVLNGELADTKADVYSYGMVLLEMVTGRKFSEFKTQSLRQWAHKEVTEGREREIVDPLLENLTEDEHTTVRTLLAIALCCTMVNPDARPDMSAVVLMIEGFFPVPPLFPEEQPQKLSPSRGHNWGSFLWEGSWTMSQVLSRFKPKAKEKGEKKGVIRYPPPKPRNVKHSTV